MINTSKFNKLKNQINKSKHFRKIKSNAMSQVNNHIRVKWET